jgi:saccharopine dehydrogenase (NAD+, L-glutamate forming)
VEPADPVSPRAFDIIVFGATGFTGGMTAEYLAKSAPAGLRWAIAGRSREALERVKQRLCAIDPRCAAVGCVLASVEDPESLRRMAAQTQVLLTTVGPFIDYGEPVVQACLAEGTDYVDSTGEPAFRALLLERHAEPARARGIRIVPSCGYDAIPADLGAFFTVRELGGSAPIALRGYLSADAEFSGGTERSAIKAMADVPSLQGAEVPSQRPGARIRIATARIERRPELGGWVAPLPTIDAAVVTSSAAALPTYGPDFTYAHHAVVGSLVRLCAGAMMVALIGTLSRFTAGRALLLRFAKPSGKGPSPERMARSWFKLAFVAESGGRVLRTEVSGGDPGYGETSKMLAESALCLALDRAQLPAQAGVLTPAVAMGDALLARLQRAGLRFRVL